MDHMGEGEEWSDQIIERGEMYGHAQHGEVEVTGIWQGVSRVGASRITDNDDTIIVCYAIDDGNTDIELTDTLNSFIEDIN